MAAAQRPYSMAMDPAAAVQAQLQALLVQAVQEGLLDDQFLQLIQLQVGVSARLIGTKPAGRQWQGGVAAGGTRHRSPDWLRSAQHHPPWQHTLVCAG